MVFVWAWLHSLSLSVYSNVRQRTQTGCTGNRPVLQHCDHLLTGCCGIASYFVLTILWGFAK